MEMWKKVKFCLQNYTFNGTYMYIYNIVCFLEQKEDIGCGEDLFTNMNNSKQHWDDDDV